MIAPAASSIAVVCPVCKGALDLCDNQIRCLNCSAEFYYDHGRPDLIVGGRFDDEDEPERTAYESLSNTFLTENYLQPLFGKLFPQRDRTRVLSLGCGVGIDVDMLRQSGFDIVGIDCGNRSKDWVRRTHQDRLYLANGKHLPFEDRSFDLVYCGCVFPHIGVQGDTNQVTPEYWQERLAVAREMTRVLRPGGRIMVSSPNRLFPLDLFHGRDQSNPYPRWNPPSSPFLLSAADYRKLFGQAGCVSSRPLPVAGYWGFIRMKQRWKGKVMAFALDSVFRAVSTEPLRFLRTSPVNPWLVMLMERGAWA